MNSPITIVYTLSIKKLIKWYSPVDGGLLHEEAEHSLGQLLEHQCEGLPDNENSQNINYNINKTTISQNINYYKKLMFITEKIVKTKSADQLLEHQREGLPSNKNSQNISTQIF